MREVKFYIILIKTKLTFAHQTIPSLQPKDYTAILKLDFYFRLVRFDRLVTATLCDFNAPTEKSKNPKLNSFTSLALSLSPSLPSAPTDGAGSQLDLPLTGNLSTSDLSLSTVPEGPSCQPVVCLTGGTWVHIQAPLTSSSPTDPSLSACLSAAGISIQSKIQSPFSNHKESF